MNFLKQFPATLALVAANVFVFLVSYLQVKTFENPEWVFNLLDLGALFNPYVLDKEWYRIFSHMFLHMHPLHLVLNMVALFISGSDTERQEGSKKFLLLYFVCGIGAGLTSLYWNMFTIGVGASGAIFGIYGFSLIGHLLRSYKQGLPVASIVLNFVIFLVINLVFAEALHADNAAHLGGLAVGMIIGLVSLHGKARHSLRPGLAFIPVLVIIYFLLPRDQVAYYQFFQKVVAAEDSTFALFEKKDLSDDAFLVELKGNDHHWDTAAHMLNELSYVPVALRADTFKLRRYLLLRLGENNYRRRMIERESYIFLDSIALVQDQMKDFLSLDHPLIMKQRAPRPRNTPEPAESNLEMTKAWYNDDWEEIDFPPATYYRLGFRDSLKRWQGYLTDHYANGDIQMKGSYKNGKRDGIFIYYSDHLTYTSAGRYKDDRSVGKWETYHHNGRLESEVYYTDRYFLKSLWDSAGNHLVKDGYGRMVRYHPNGIVAEEGAYEDGYRHGYWLGRHENGDLYYQEYYDRGRLTSGKSRSKHGDQFVYDESSLFPSPEGGYKALYTFINKQVSGVNSDVKGEVKLSFRVTTKRSLTDLKIEEGLSEELNEEAKQILLKGPRWVPARLHGQEPVDGLASVTIRF